MEMENKIISQLAAETGVSEGDVQKIVTKLHLDKSLSRLESFVGETRIEGVTVNDLRIGVMFDRNLIHR